MRIPKEKEKEKRAEDNPSQQVHPRAESRQSISSKRFDANPLSSAFFSFSSLTSPYSNLSPSQHFLFSFPPSPQFYCSDLDELLEGKKTEGFSRQSLV